MDTTYYLPLAGMAVSGEPDVLARVLRNHTVVLSDINVVEITATWGKALKGHRLEADAVERALKTLLGDPRLSRASVLDPEVASHALKLRRSHADIHDCLLLAQALTVSDRLVTEDSPLLDLSASEEIRALAARFNPRFSVSPSKRLFSG